MDYTCAISRKCTCICSKCFTYDNILISQVINDLLLHSTRSTLIKSRLKTRIKLFLSMHKFINILKLHFLFSRIFLLKTSFLRNSIKVTKHNTNSCRVPQLSLLFEIREICLKFCFMTTHIKMESNLGMSFI